MKTITRHASSTFPGTFPKTVETLNGRIFPMMGPLLNLHQIKKITYYSHRYGRWIEIKVIHD